MGVNKIRTPAEVAELGFVPWRQLPPGVDFTNVTQMVDWMDAVRDQRVDDWFLMASPWPTLYLATAYVVLVLLGMHVLMRNRQPWSDTFLKPVMIAYNVIVICINAYMFVGLLYAAYWRAGFSLVCNAVDYSDEGLPVLHLVYVYYLSKLVDFSDTFFMIVRKKFDQVSFLHVYHHSSMFVIWWGAVKYGGGGDLMFGPMLNSFVHVVMYSYYLSALLRIRMPGKKYLTRMQMIQFFMVIGHSTLSIALDCPFPHWSLYCQMVFLTSLFYLFLRFYIKSYSTDRDYSRPRKAALAPAAPAAALPSAPAAASGRAVPAAAVPVFEAEEAPAPAAAKAKSRARSTTPKRKRN